MRIPEANARSRPVDRLQQFRPISIFSGDILELRGEKKEAINEDGIGFLTDFSACGFSDSFSFSLHVSGLLDRITTEYGGGSSEIESLELFFVTSAMM